MLKISFSPLTGLLSLVFLVLTASIGVPVAYAEEVSCSNEWAQQALGYLRQRLGFTPSFYYCFILDEGDTYEWPGTFDEVDLSMSINHAYVAECDRDCDDVDLEVYRQDGSLIGRDTRTDSYAEVSVRDVYVGMQTDVHITMFSCSTDYCGVVLGVVPRR